MTIEQKEVSKEEEKKTPDQNASTDEKNAGAKEEDTSGKTKSDEGQEKEWTPPTKEEFEKISKKATDFDGMIEKKRLEKLNKKEQKSDTAPDKKEEGVEKKEEVPAINADEIIARAERAAENRANEILGKAKREGFENNLKDAYHEFLKVNPWADNDDIIGSISKSFSANGAVQKDEILARLNIAAQNSFPTEYQKSIENKLRAKILSEEKNIDAGDGGSAGAIKKIDDKYVPTQEDIAMANRFFEGNMERWLKQKVKQAD